MKEVIKPTGYAPGSIATLALLIVNKKISYTTACIIFNEMYLTGRCPVSIINEKDLWMIG